MNKKKVIPVCPKCGNKDTRARIKTNDMFCRRCGYVGKREEFFKNNYEGGKNENSNQELKTESI